MYDKFCYVHDFVRLLMFMYMYTYIGTFFCKKSRNFWHLNSNGSEKVLTLTVLIEKYKTFASLEDRF